MKHSLILFFCVFVILYWFKFTKNNCDTKSIEGDSEDKKESISKFDILTPNPSLLYSPLNIPPRNL